MKASLLARLVALTVVLLTAAAQAHGQAPPPLPAEGTGPPDQATPIFPSPSVTRFPDSMGSEDFPATTNPGSFDTTMPESGTGTGTNSTFGGSGTGSGGLGASTYGPYTESPLRR